MSKTRLLRSLLRFGVLSTLFFYAAARPAVADSKTVDGITLTISTSGLTVTEGTPATVNYSITNASGWDITFGTLFCDYGGACGTLGTLGPVTGDVTDAYSALLPGKGCPPGLANGATCTNTITFLTAEPPITDTDTDSDSGVNPFGISIGFHGLIGQTGPPGCSALTVSTACEVNLSENLTIVDPSTTTPTPEPSTSLLLVLGMGVLGILLSLSRGAATRALN